MAKQVQQNKKALIEALELSLGIVTSACRAAKLDRTTFYRYVNDDPDFAKAVGDISNVALDAVEGALFRQIQADVPASTIFYLKTKGKDRGYVERIENKQVVDEDLERIRTLVTSWAKENGTTLEHELKFVLDRYGSTLPKNVTQQLTSELVN